MIKCAECTKEISDKAPACIHCGAPVVGNEPKSDPTSVKFEKGGREKVVDEALRKAAEKAGVDLTSDDAKTLKDKARQTYDQAVLICKNLADVNGDGRFDAEDLKAAAEKAGLVWDKFDPDLKEALLAGGVAGAALFFIPIAGHMLAIPVFAATTAYFYLFAKLKKAGKSRKAIEQ